MPVTLAEAIEHYRIHRAAGLSESTRKAQMGAYRRFAQRIEPRAFDLEAITRRMMLDYVEQFRPPGHSPATFNNYRQYLVLLFDHCRAEGWLAADPIRDVRPMRVGRRNRLHLTANECLRALQGAPPRDRIALALGMFTALRAHDITALSVSDVNLNEGWLSAWIEKTDSEDRIPITAELADELRRWMDGYAATMLTDRTGLDPKWALVPPAHWIATNPHHPRSGGRVIYRPTGRLRHPELIVQRALAQLGYPTKGEGFHTLRRSAARSTLELASREGLSNPIRIAQALLGHQSQATTERYLGLEVDRQARDALFRGRRMFAVTDSA